MSLPHFLTTLALFCLPLHEAVPRPEPVVARVNCERCASMGTLTVRIPRDRDEISVFHAGQRAKLGQFIELGIGTLNPKTKPESLIGRHIVLSRSLQKADQWEIQSGAAWGELNLPENIFGITAIFISTRTAPVEIHVNGKLFRWLNTGEALLVLR